VKSGKVRLLAVGTAKRSQGLPDTPTLLESGINMTAVSVVGIFAPAGTPSEVISRLSREVSRIMLVREANIKAQ
jgi:tripartite-type tricarboxylate transporter receptor subunit TctC